MNFFLSYQVKLQLFALITAFRYSVVWESLKIFQPKDFIETQELLKSMAV
jgi:hypothetical protein